ncbi:MAG TPA: hypothetical protein VGN17_11340 [Bryobacteraceae bacterium]|jgi:hypothetical protein
MAGRIVVIHDTRLAGPSPNGELTLVRVNAQTPLSQLVQQINNIAFQYGDDIRVRIMCHGYEDDSGRGGYGIQLCRENLTLNTVNQLAPWSGNLSFGITIYSCATADVAPGCEGIIGDGRLLCSRIARITGTEVRAADATQNYRYFNLLGIITSPIDFGRWEGNVLEWDARGALVETQHAPEQ